MSESNLQEQPSRSSSRRRTSRSPACASACFSTAKKSKGNRKIAATPKPAYVKGTHYVEKIMKKRYVNGRAQLLLKWRGYPSDQSTWEPIENLSGDCMRMLADFEAELFAEHCKRVKCKTETSQELNLLNPSSPNDVNAFLEVNSSPAATVKESASENQSKQPSKTLSTIMNTANRIKDVWQEQLQEQLLQEEQSQERQSQMEQPQQQQQKKAEVEQPEEQRRQLAKPSKSQKIARELNLSSDSSSSGSDSTSIGSGSDSGSSSSGSSSDSSSSDSEREDQQKQTPKLPAVVKRRPFDINLHVAHKLNLSSEDDTDEDVAPAALSQNVNSNSVSAKTPIQKLKEQARMWHDKKTAHKVESQVPTTTPACSPPKNPKVMAGYNQLLKQRQMSTFESSSTPKSRRMTVNVNSIEECMEKIHRSGSSVRRRMSLDKSGARDNSPQKRQNNANTMPCKALPPKQNESVDRSRNRSQSCQQNMCLPPPNTKEPLKTAESLDTLPPNTSSNRKRPQSTTPKTPRASPISSSGGSCGSSKSARGGNSASSYASNLGNWDDSLVLPTRPQGIERGMALEKILKSFKMRGETYLVVKWKTVSMPDAVLLSGVIELYPHIIIEYFEKLQLRSPLD